MASSTFTSGDHPRYYCPCCGYPELDTPPYEHLAGPPFPRGLTPPYHYQFGEPSYYICRCCGYEFGNDDEPGTALPASFDEYLREWIGDGCQWFDPAARPDGWNLDAQLRKAGIATPE